LGYLNLKMDFEKKKIVRELLIVCHQPIFVSTLGRGRDGTNFGVFWARKIWFSRIFFGRKWLIWLIPLVDDHQFGYITPKKDYLGKNN
jgi:hypothetical protein